MRSAKLPMAASARSSVAGQHHRRARLVRERLLPHRRMRVERQDPLGIAGQAVRHLRIERVPGALADELHDALVAAEHALEGRIDRERVTIRIGSGISSPSRGRAARARPSARAGRRVGPAPPATAPARRRACPPPRRRRPGAYAARAPVAEAGRRPARARQPRAVGVGKRLEEPGQDITPRPVHERMEVGRQRTAEDVGPRARRSCSPNASRQA